MNLNELTKEKYFSPNFFKPSNVLPTMMNKKVEATKLPGLLRKSFKDLEKISGLHKEIAEYLNALLDNAISNKTIPATLIQKLKKNPFLKEKGDSNRKAIQGINTDLGEIFGSLWAAHNKKYFGLDPKDVCIFFPSADNEPLYDYVIYAKVPVNADGKKSTICEHKRGNAKNKGTLNSQKTTLVSAKTAGTANTIKFHDIIGKLKPKKELYKFWSKGPPTLQFLIAEHLATRGPQLGPIYGLHELCADGYVSRDIMPKKTLDVIVKLYQTSTGTVPGNAKKKITELADVDDLEKIGAAIKGICMEDSTLRERYVSGNKLMLTSNKGSVAAAEKDILLGYISVAAEKIIGKVCGEHGDVSMVDFVKDALSGEVDYMVYNIGGTLVPTYNFASKDELDFGGGPRSKNSMSGRMVKNGLSDALGFGPHFK